MTINALPIMSIPPGLARRRVLLGGLGAAITLPLTVPLAGCGGGAELFVPYFVFTFDGPLNGITVSFFLNPDAQSSCKETGRFADSLVTVRYPDGDKQFVVAGSFSGRSVSLTITSPPALLAASYSGEFIADGTLALTGGGATFNVVRTGARAASCPAGG